MQSVITTVVTVVRKMHMDLGLTGKIAVVTGSDSGIGKATAELLGSLC